MHAYEKIDRRTGLGRGHMSMFQSNARFARPLYVCMANYSFDPLCSCLRKWFMLALGPHDLHKMLAGFDDKSAEAVCTFAYSEGPGHNPIIFQGRTPVRQIPPFAACKC